MKVRLQKVLMKTKVEGPGTRFCIWVQGCSHHCEGCALEDTWDYNGGYEKEVSELIQEILNQKNIEGITYLGGEPFDQADALSEIAEEIKKRNLSVLTFTGYHYDELKKSKEVGKQKLLSLTDLLIDGPFIKDQFDLSRPWVGSKNQKYYFLTDQYRYLENNLHTIKNKVEVHLETNGQVFVNGMGDFELIKKQIQEKMNGI